MRRKASRNRCAVVERDPWLHPFEGFFEHLRGRIESTEQRLTVGRSSLLEVATAHEHFGLHREGEGWVFREWAPNARRVFLIGDFSGWKPSSEYSLERKDGGEWEIRLPRDRLSHLDYYRLFLEWPGGSGERIPAYARYVHQDAHTQVFSAQVWEPDKPYSWRVPGFKRPNEPPLIYEAHVGMAQEDGRVGTYREFEERTLPRIVEAGYNAVQLMAIMEHPYYGSFGYQVSSFFAPSSRFGTPDELRSLIDGAHERGLQVFLDIVHSHAVKNEVEGLSRFDGTLYQYFHDGSRGEHPLWNSRLFNYGKDEVLCFLLSNIRYWVDYFRFDGFRFDGVTSMLYYDHGLGEPFTSYDRYFSGNCDQEALTYLVLANKLCRSLGDVVTIAEDVSGLPGLAAPLEDGGFGFDYRLAMGIPDLWVKMIKKQDHEWHVEHIYYELTNRRWDEKTISYAECHDQALVGDQTIIYRLLQDLMYTSMRVDQFNHLVDRGLALHRLIRLITLVTAGHGYLNFMGNEFGHPEWIDFPRPGNNWSYHHARRLWSLCDNCELVYHKLAEFDRQMIAFVRENAVIERGFPVHRYAHVEHQVLAFERGGFYFAFNFSPTRSFPDYGLEAAPGEYKLAFDSDAREFGGNGRVAPGQTYHSVVFEHAGHSSAELKLYLPTRTALVLRRVELGVPRDLSSKGAARC